MSEIRPDPAVPTDVEDSAPPRFLGTWRRWYVLVIAELAVVVILSYLLTLAFR